MKGIILAGGKGIRMYPLTAVTNKHLIPVGNLPMIEYPLYTLRKLRVNSIAIVTGGEYFQSIVEYLVRVHPDIDFTFFYQKEAGGIAQALSLVENFVGNDKIAVILGDNVFEDDFYESAKNFEGSDLGSMLFLRQVMNPQIFGVAELGGDKIISIEEKPESPKSNYAVTGIYFYDSSVFEKIRKLKPSTRGEYEISEVNNMYVKESKAGFQIVRGFWNDAGTFNSRRVCEEFVQKRLEKEVREF